MLLKALAFSVIWSAVLYGQQWESIASMPQPLSDFGISTLEDGNILVAGGTGSTLHSGTATYIYNPVTDEWTVAGKLNIPRTGAPMVKLQDGRLFFPSGLCSQDSMTFTCEVYSPSTQAWALTENLKQRRYAESATTLPNGKVLIVGGMDWETRTTHATCELYDPELYDAPQI